MVLDSLGVTWLMMDVRIGLLAMRDRGHVHVGIVFLQVDMPVRFAEWPFRLEELRADVSLDDIFGLRRHQQIDGLRAGDVMGPFANEPATAISSS